MRGLIKDGLGTSLNEEVPRKSNRITEVRVRSVLNIFFPKNISQVTSFLDWRLKGVILAIEVIMKPIINICLGFPSLLSAVDIISANTFSRPVEWWYSWFLSKDCFFRQRGLVGSNGHMWISHKIVTRGGAQGNCAIQVFHLHPFINITHIFSLAWCLSLLTPLPFYQTVFPKEDNCTWTIP